MYSIYSPVKQLIDIHFILFGYPFKEINILDMHPSKFESHIFRGRKVCRNKNITYWYFKIFITGRESRFTKVAN